MSIFVSSELNSLLKPKLKYVDIKCGFFEILVKHNYEYNSTFEHEVQAELYKYYIDEILPIIRNTQIILHLEMQVPTVKMAEYFLSKIKSERISYGGTDDNIYTVVMFQDGSEKVMR